MNKNTIYLGDCNELIRQLPDKSIDCIYTDIPYLYQMGGGGSSDVALRIRKNADRLEQANIDKGIDYNIFYEFARVMKKINCYIWCSKMQILDILNWWTDYANRHEIKVFYEVLVWCKTNPTPATNNTWLPDVEYCLYFRESGIKLNDGYEHKHKYFVSGLNVLDKNDYEHPTIKPLEFVKHHILHTTNPGDLILDPYLGSGTTAVACKETGRSYNGFEINEEYFKIASDRLSGWNQKGEMNLFASVEEPKCEQLDLFGGDSNDER
jgi:DNA modification methylase